MAALPRLLVAACLLCSLHLAAAGCAGEIFDCNGARNPCASKQCGSGLVCRTDNCKGCFAKCEPPGMVHIMSLPSSAGAPTGSGGRVTSEAGPSNSKADAPAKGSSGPAQGAPCPCPRIFSPVCGSDGRKYDNECLAKCAQATVLTQKPDASGNCPKVTLADPKPATRPQGACACPFILDPVCADGKKFDNRCLAEKCAGATVTGKPDSNGNCPSASSAGSQGPSKPAGASCPCPRILRPVCGADGKNYANDCLARCAQTTVTDQKPDANGNCPKAAASAPPKVEGKPQGFTCRCAAIYSPVCGEGGKFFDNACMAMCEGVKVSSVKPDLANQKCNMS